VSNQLVDDFRPVGRVDAKVVRVIQFEQSGGDRERSTDLLITAAEGEIGPLDFSMPISYCRK
jgi:hypothetical protein